MGTTVVRGVASHLVQATLYDLKAEAWPLSRDNWRAEARGHWDEARETYTPSMKDRPGLTCRSCTGGRSGGCPI
jgi:hypothetical protein